MTTNIEALKTILAERGEIPTIRISKARCGACEWQYWDYVRYSIRPSKCDGRPVNVALEAASRNRRSLRLASRDGDEVAEAEGRIWLSTIGTLTEEDAGRVLDQLAERGELAA